MPSRATSPMDQRFRFIVEAERGFHSRNYRLRELDGLLSQQTDASPHGKEGEKTTN